MAFDRAGGWTGTAATRYDGPRGDVSSGSAFTEDQVIMEYHFIDYRPEGARLCLLNDTCISALS